MVARRKKLSLWLVIFFRKMKYFEIISRLLFCKDESDLFFYSEFPIFICVTFFKWSNFFICEVDIFLKYVTNIFVYFEEKTPSQIKES